MRERKNISTVALETLGCKLNQAESESMVRQLAAAGYRIVQPSDGADVYILNTCTVTHVADRKSRHLLRLARRRNLNALIIAIGCYVERAPEEVAEVEEVDITLDNGEKAFLLQVLNQGGLMDTAPAINPSPMLRTRSMVKIQEGCNQFCSYCIVPVVRGRERSVSQEQIVDEVKARVAMGYREVVLTGTQIGAYSPSLELGLRSVLAESDVARLRLSSLQPQDLSPQLIALWADRRLCRHLHLPLQSGSDRVLVRMRRRYSTTDYEQAVTMVREAIPDIAITTDIMVGFPGENEEEFEQSYRFCQRMGFANIHVFTYSERPGTAALQMSDKVPEEVKKERSVVMLGLARESALRFRQQFLGRTMAVLWEQETEEEVWSGLTDNYIRVFTKSSQRLENKLLETRITGWRNGGLWGELCIGKPFSALCL